MARQEFSRKTKAQAFERAQGHCELCGLKLQTGRIEYDHIVPCELSGDNSLGNCQCICTACHSAKTGQQDVPAIRKSDRQRDKHNGAFRKSSRGFRKAPPQRSASRPLSKRVGQFGEQQ